MPFTRISPLASSLTATCITWINYILLEAYFVANAVHFETLNGRLPLKHGCDRRQTSGKRVSDDPRHFMFRRRKHKKTSIFFETLNGRCRCWLRSSSNFGKTRFRRSPTFHFSTFGTGVEYMTHRGGSMRPTAPHGFSDPGWRG